MIRVRVPSEKYVLDFNDWIFECGPCSSIPALKAIICICNLNKGKYTKIHHSKEDSEKSFIAHACFHNVKIGIKVAVVAFKCLFAFSKYIHMI